MSVGVAVGAAASGQAAIAANQAARAECAAKMSAYQPDTATVAEQRYYANCVYRLHGDGEPIAPDMALVLKLLIVASFLAAAYGFRKGWQEDWMAAVLFAACGAVCPWVVAFVAVLAGAALQFLFS